MAEIDPLKQLTDYEVTKGSNFKFAPSQKFRPSGSASPLLPPSDRGGDLSGTSSESSDEDIEDIPGEDPDSGGGDEDSGGGGGNIKLPSDFTVEFSPRFLVGGETIYGRIVPDTVGNYWVSVDATCSPVAGATNFEIKLVKIS
jgi:hypothetical protein